MQLTRTITFNHRQESIYPFLQEVTRFLEANLAGRNAGLAFKAKVIVTELLTNSIKHVTNGRTDVQFSLTTKALTIIKTDSGGPFAVGTELLEWPSAAAIGTLTKVYADSLNGLFARLTSPLSLTFFTEDYGAGRDELADLSEHYGLMIIARAADSFTYEIEPDKGLNTFTATINL